MTFSRLQRQEAVAHFVTVLCDLPDDGPLAKSLAYRGFTDIHDVVTITVRNVERLAYDDSGTLTPLADGHQSLVLIFRAYFEYRCDNGDPIGETFTSITHEGFDQFRIGPLYRDIRDNPPAKRTSQSGDINTEPFKRLRSVGKKFCNTSLSSTPNEFQRLIDKFGQNHPATGVEALPPWNRDAGGKDEYMPMLVRDAYKKNGQAASGRGNLEPSCGHRNARNRKVLVC
jgi:hypothetical protein